MKNKYYKLPKFSDKYVILISERDYGKEKADKEYKLKRILKDVKLCLKCKCDGCYFRREDRYKCVDKLYEQLVEVIYENNK